MPRLRTKRRKFKRKLSYHHRDYNTTIKILKLLAEKGTLSTKEIAEYRGEENGSIFSYSHTRIKLKMIRLEDLDLCEQHTFVTNKNHTCPFCKKSTNYLVSTQSLDAVQRNINYERERIDESRKLESYDPSQWSIPTKSNHVFGKSIPYMKCKGCDMRVQTYLADEYKVVNYRYWSLSYNGALVLLTLLKSKKLSKFILRNIHHEIIELIHVLIQSRKNELVQTLYDLLQDRVKVNLNLINIANEWFKESRKRILKMNLHTELDFALIDYKKNHHL